MTVAQGYHSCIVKMDTTRIAQAYKRCAETKKTTILLEFHDVIKLQKKTMTPAAATLTCSATTLNGARCRAKAVCSGLCRRHAVSVKDLSIL